MINYAITIGIVILVIFIYEGIKKIISEIKDRWTDGNIVHGHHHIKLMDAGDMMDNFICSDHHFPDYLKEFRKDGFKNWGKLMTPELEAARDLKTNKIDPTFYKYSS